MECVTQKILAILECWIAKWIALNKKFWIWILDCTPKMLECQIPWEGGTCFREIMKREPNWTMISIIYFRFMDCCYLLNGFQIQWGRAPSPTKDGRSWEKTSGANGHHVKYVRREGRPVRYQRNSERIGFRSKCDRRNSDVIQDSRTWRGLHFRPNRSD